MHQVLRNLTAVCVLRPDVHQFCTPTRTSVQSGRLPVHVSTGLGSPCGDNTGISQNMTGFAERLKEAGYTTAFAGKWGTRKFMRGVCLCFPLEMFDSEPTCFPFCTQTPGWQLPHTLHTAGKRCCLLYTAVCWSRL